MRGYILFILILLSSCIEEFPLETDIPNAEPVIEGLVADQPGDSFVRISSKLGLFGIQEDPSDLVSNAQVMVIAGGDNEIAFGEVSTGLYKPSDVLFAGTTGETYQLFITLSDGRFYQSETEVLNPGVGIDSIFAIFKEQTIPNTDQLSGEHRFFVEVVKQVPGQDVFFRTQSFGIAQVAAYIDPPPPSCPPRCTEICYSFRRPVNRKIVLGTTQGSSQDKVTLQAAVETYDFHSRYYLEVKTFSLSQQGYQFWKSLAQQQEIEGTIFDPPVTEIRGNNVYEVSTNQEIIGYFGASQISTDSLMIDRAESAGFVTPIPTASNSCVEVWRNASLEVPIQFQ